MTRVEPASVRHAHGRSCAIQFRDGEHWLRTHRFFFISIDTNGDSMNEGATGPVRFDPEMERPETDEAETRDALIETMRSISETTFKDGATAFAASTPRATAS